ncbi:DUF881 domain-containing protein [Nocardioides sp. SYSU DS0651]|uniref:DUF881 domain-containing protein n=1 Tax=Nocardioides sp. SYSU DS0651 TaxID=3415955 RepID=UPI003F4C0324
MPEEQEAPATAVQRLKTALLRPSRKQVVAAVLLALLGFAAVTQVRVAGTDETLEGLREQELIDLLDALSGTRQRTQAEIERLEDVREELRDDTTSRRAALEQAQTEADNLRVLAGLVPVTGPGIRITITEEEGRVHLASLLDTIQELRTVGAEAIAINGKVRVIAQTAFAETDGGFVVDGERLEAPYVIDVIGEPGVLSAAIEFALGPRQQLEEDGARVSVEELQRLDIEAVAETEEPSFAVPDQGQ